MVAFIISRTTHQQRQAVYCYTRPKRYAENNRQARGAGVAPEQCKKIVVCCRTPAPFCRSPEFISTVGKQRTTRHCKIGCYSVAQRHGPHKQATDALRLTGEPLCIKEDGKWRGHGSATYRPPESSAVATCDCSLNSRNRNHSHCYFIHIDTFLYQSGSKSGCASVFITL
jgi:hypothetical protein